MKTHGYIVFLPFYPKLKEISHILYDIYDETAQIPPGRTTILKICAIFMRQILNEHALYPKHDTDKFDFDFLVKLLLWSCNRT